MLCSKRSCSLLLGRGNFIVSQTTLSLLQRRAGGFFFSFSVWKSPGNHTQECKSAVDAEAEKPHLPICTCVIGDLEQQQPKKLRFLLVISDAAGPEKQ